MGVMGQASIVRWFTPTVLALMLNPCGEHKREQVHPQTARARFLDAMSFHAKPTMFVINTVHRFPSNAFVTVYRRSTLP